MQGDRLSRPALYALLPEDQRDSFKRRTRGNQAHRDGGERGRGARFRLLYQGKVEQQQSVRLLLSFGKVLSRFRYDLLAERQIRTRKSRIVRGKKLFYPPKRARGERHALSLRLPSGGRGALPLFRAENLPGQQPHARHRLGGAGKTPGRRDVRRAPRLAQRRQSARPLYLQDGCGSRGRADDHARLCGRQHRLSQPVQRRGAGGRRIKIYGTKGEIEGFTEDGYFTVRLYNPANILFDERRETIADDIAGDNLTAETAAS